VTERSYGTATLRGSTWEVEAEPHVAMALKRWFKKSDRGAAGKLKLSNTPDVCRDLEWFAGRYPLAFSPDFALRSGASQHRERILRVQDFLGDTFRPRSFVGMAIQPRTYQARNAEVCFAQGGLLVADELGLGKTCTAITLLSNPECRPAVVVCPVHLQRQWVDEVLKFAPSLQVHVVKRSAPYPLPLFFGQGPDVVVCPYSKLAHWSQVLAAYAKAVIFDECHELRRDSSQKYDAAEAIGEKAQFRMGLSATPVFNYGGEIYNILSVLTPGRLGTREEFNREWCKSPTSQGQFPLKDPRAFGSWARDEGLIVRHTRTEVGRELPPVITTIQTVEADASVLDRLEGDAATLARIILKEHQDSRGEKMQAAEEFSNKLRQAIGIAKAPFVADFVRLLVESGEQVLLAGWHREVYGIWEKKLAGIPIAYYTGSESPAQKDESKRRFLKGEAKVMFISLRSGAGLDGLQTSCKVVVVGELDWSPAVHEQLIGRLHRDGQEVPVLAYYLVAETGADPIIAQVLGLKRSQVEGIREPKHAIVQPLNSDPDRMKHLAADFLKRRHHLEQEPPLPALLLAQWGPREGAA
jgi:superfamily II DNA or RNA helicase